MFGLTVAYSICIQISILVDNYGGGVELGNLPDTYVLPILWAEMVIGRFFYFCFLNIFRFYFNIKYNNNSTYVFSMLFTN